MMSAFACGAAHLQLLLPLHGELFERLDNDSRVGAVVDENGRAPHPRLQVVDGQWDVLRVVLKKTEKERRCHERETRTLSITLLLIDPFQKFVVNY